MIRRALALCLALAALTAPAAAQTAMALFGSQGTPSPHPPYSIGAPARGCLAGGVQLPESGATWQAMRLSRNHHWGNPQTIAFIEDLSRTATRAGWRGLYVGDIAQARGGPVKGHASHQTGLDIDVWKLIELANHHPRVNILQPGPGVGGHCIAVDPWFIVDGAPGLEAALTALWGPDLPIQRCTVGLLKKSLPSIGFRPWRMEDVRGPSRPDVAGFPFRREFARVGQR